jgi:hypothetical protein
VIMEILKDLMCKLKLSISQFSKFIVLQWNWRVLYFSFTWSKVFEVEIHWN